MVDTLDFVDNGKWVVIYYDEGQLRRDKDRPIKATVSLDSDEEVDLAVYTVPDFWVCQSTNSVRWPTKYGTDSRLKRASYTREEPEKDWDTVACTEIKWKMANDDFDDTWDLMDICVDDSTDAEQKLKNKKDKSLRKFRAKKRKSSDEEKQETQQSLTKELKRTKKKLEHDDGMLQSFMQQQPDPPKQAVKLQLKQASSTNLATINSSQNEKNVEYSETLSANPIDDVKDTYELPSDAEDSKPSDPKKANVTHDEEEIDDGGDLLDKICSDEKDTVENGSSLQNEHDSEQFFAEFDIEQPSTSKSTEPGKFTSKKGAVKGKLKGKGKVKPKILASTSTKITIQRDSEGFLLGNLKNSNTKKSPTPLTEYIENDNVAPHIEPRKEETENVKTNGFGNKQSGTISSPLRDTDRTILQNITNTLKDSGSKLDRLIANQEQIIANQCKEKVFGAAPPLETGKWVRRKLLFKELIERSDTHKKFLQFDKKLGDCADFQQEIECYLREKVDPDDWEESIRSILNASMNNKVQQLYSAFGRKGKEKFVETNLYPILEDLVLKGTTKDGVCSTTEKKIKSYLSGYMKQAKNRAGGYGPRKKKGTGESALAVVGELLFGEGAMLSLDGIAGGSQKKKKPQDTSQVEESSDEDLSRDGIANDSKEKKKLQDTSYVQEDIDVEDGESEKDVD